MYHGIMPEGCSSEGCAALLQGEVELNSIRGYSNFHSPDLSFIQNPELPYLGDDDSNRMRTLFKSATKGTIVDTDCGDGNIPESKPADSSPAVSCQSSSSEIFPDTTEELINSIKHGGDIDKFNNKNKIVGPNPQILTLGENMLVNTALRVGSRVFNSIWNMAVVLFSKDVSPGEDLLKFNGFTIQTFGSVILDSINFNEKGSKFRLKLRLGRPLTSHVSVPDLKQRVEGNKWILMKSIGIGLQEEAVCEVVLPLGCCPSQMKVEKALDGIIVINSP